MAAVATAYEAPQLAIRTDPSNPNHHLWNNHGTWFIHYTIYPDALTAVRLRQSLKTRNVETARKRRDLLFARRRAAWEKGGGR